MTAQQQHDISSEWHLLNHTKEIGNISKTCRYFGISRESFYKWKPARIWTMLAVEVERGNAELQSYATNQADKFRFCSAVASPQPRLDFEHKL